MVQAMIMMPEGCDKAAMDASKEARGIVVRRRLAAPGAKAWMRRPKIVGDNLEDGSSGHSWALAMETLSKASTDDEPWSPLNADSVGSNDSGCEGDSAHSTCDSFKDEELAEDADKACCQPSTCAPALVVRKRLTAPGSKAWMRRARVVGDDLEDGVDGLAGDSPMTSDEERSIGACSSTLISAETFGQTVVPSTRVCVAGMRTASAPSDLAVTFGVPDNAASHTQGMPASPSSTFAPGSAVILCNLTQQADFNGLVGTVTSFDEDHGRYNVLLEKEMAGAHRTMKIKAANLFAAVLEAGPEIDGKPTLVLDRLVA